MKNNVLDKADIDFIIRQINLAIKYKNKGIIFEKFKLESTDKDYTIMSSYKYDLRKGDERRNE